jgi:hypothetical protein
MVSNKSMNFKSMINLSPKKATKTIDFDLDQKLLEALK